MRSRARSSPARAAGLRDQRKPRVHERPGRDARATDRPARRCARALAHDRARHAIARREIAGRIVARHERARPRALTSRAPSPRSASDSRNRGCPGTFSAVGWNCTNSRSATARAGAIRHRDAVAGRDRRIGRLADRPARRRRSRAAPTCARATPRSPSSCRNSTPTQRPSSTIRIDDARVRVRSATLGERRRRAATATRPISRPVASCACSTRRTLCAPSMRRAPARRRRRDRTRAPQSISSRT